jgi:putative spermidine/putrescine transport system ATP-binding protein
MRIANTAASGEVDVMIRPERLRLRAAAQADGPDNSFDMTIDDIINYGDSILAIGATHGLPLRARIFGSEPEVLRRGMTVKLAWSPADAHTLVRR